MSVFMYKIAALNNLTKCKSCANLPIDRDVVAVLVSRPIKVSSSLVSSRLVSSLIPGLGKEGLVHILGTQTITYLLTYLFGRGDGQGLGLPRLATILNSFAS